MEENTFLDENPTFNVPTYQRPARFQSAMAGDDTNAIDRWWHPQIAENEQFHRENYFVDKENAFNEYMFNKTNEYNSAAAQMERAKEAGINPNLMAAGIAGTGGSQAMPMQGARGDTGMNNSSVNPIENLSTIGNLIGNGIDKANTLGELFGFGKKNKEEIKLIHNNAIKAAEEMNYTRAQRKQLEGIGEILIDNAKKEGKQIDENINNLKELNNVYKAQKENIEADTELKGAQTGTEEERQKTQEYENAKLQYEKIFRELFGMELTHEQMAMLVEACLNGKGENIVNFLTDTIAGVFKGLGKEIRNAFENKKEEPKQAITVTDKTGKTKQIEFKNNRDKKRWQKTHLKYAKKVWEAHGKKQSFDKFLDIYCNQRGIKKQDLFK